MSYDLEVWSAACPDAAALLPQADGWKRSAERYVREGHEWQVVVSSPDRVMPEDVPPEVSAELPGTTHLTHITLSPVAAPKSVRTIAVKCARALAKQAHGVVVDKQEDTVTTPTGVKRFVPQKRPERFAAIELSWWFTDGPLLEQTGLDAFVACLARLLPEGLPRRYGLHEPPQHRLEESGLDHFRAFLAEHVEETVVWYPSRPVVNVGVCLERAPGAKEYVGFRCSTIYVGVEAAALSQPGWQAGLAAFWREASALIRPFYGDVRTLHGLIRGGATYGADMKTDMGPVQGPWWRGIPRDVGHAFVVGSPYVELWPELSGAAERRGSLSFVDSGDWRQGSAQRAVGAVPEAIAQRWTPTWTQSKYGGLGMRWNNEYPEQWPFGPRPPAGRPFQ